MIPHPEETPFCPRSPQAVAKQYAYWTVVSYRATNETHSVREFTECVFRAVDMEIVWKGESGSVDEIGVDASNPDNVLGRVTRKYFRPTEVGILIGNPAKAKPS